MESHFAKFIARQSFPLYGTLQYLIPNNLRAHSLVKFRSNFHICICRTRWYNVIYKINVDQCSRHIKPVWRVGVPVFPLVLVHLVSPSSSSLSLSPRRSLSPCDAYEGPSQRGRSYGEESHLEAVGVGEGWGCEKWGVSVPHVDMYMYMYMPVRVCECAGMYMYVNESPYTISK